MYTCPQSPQLLKLDWSQLWRHSVSVQTFHRCRVYQVHRRDLICSSPNAERALFPFLIAQPLGLSFGFHPLCMWPPTLLMGHPRGLISAQERGDETVVDWGTPSHSDPGRDKVATTGARMQCLWQQRPAGTDWDAPVAVLQKLAPDCGTHSSGGPRRLPRSCGQWPTFTLSGSGSSSSGRGLPLVSEIAAATRATPWSSCRRCPATCEHTEKESLLSLSSCLIHSPPHGGCECK